MKNKIKASKKIDSVTSVQDLDREQLLFFSVKRCGSNESGEDLLDECRSREAREREREWEGGGGGGGGEVKTWFQT